MKSFTTIRLITIVSETEERITDGFDTLRQIIKNKLMSLII